MHAEVVEGLEEYLSGTLKPAAQREIDAHLGKCAECRQELAGMQEISQLFSAMVPEEAVSPAPGFHNRVIRQVGGRKAVSAFASFFAPELAFGRRLVFASLLVLAVLAGYLVSREAEYPNGPEPDLVMAQQESRSFEGAQAHEAMLATMTSYKP
jgi:anti-sigma factor RsiW